jgi:hypothetical protein
MVLAIRVLARHLFRDRKVRRELIAFVHLVFFDLAREQL